MTSSKPRTMSRKKTADCSDRVTLSEALSELAPDERAVVVLSAVQGYTTREIWISSTSHMGQSVPNFIVH